MQFAVKDDDVRRQVGRVLMDQLQSIADGRADGDSAQAAALLAALEARVEAVEMPLSANTDTEGVYHPGSVPGERRDYPAS